jgi:hypothetical protein
MTYDEWKLETPEDEYARKHPEKFRRGVYTVIVTRTSTTTVEIEAGSEEDARVDAVIAAKSVPEAQWESDYDTDDVEGPPERDPDDARDDAMDRDQ